MIKAIIFDVDGTLAETEEAHRQAFNETFKDAGLDWHWTVGDYTRLLKTTGGKERMRDHRDSLGDDSPSDGRIANLHREKTNRYTDILSNGGLEPCAGVMDWVSQARANGLKLAIATTTSRPNVEALCKALWGKGAEEVFDVIAAGDEVDAKKPAPDVYNLALKRLGCSPHEAIAIEDSANGLNSAKRAGLKVVITPSTYSKDDDFAGADWMTESLSSIDLNTVIK